MQLSDRETSSIPVFKFSTLDFPKKERFGVWVNDLICDSKWDNTEGLNFDAEAKGAALGPFIISRRSWIDRQRPTTYEFYRTERRVRLDDQDSFRFLLILSGRVFARSKGIETNKMPGELFFLDDAQPFECAYETGDIVSLALPREFLPDQAAKLQGQTLSTGVGGLLGGHLLSLFKNLHEIKKHEIPYVVQSTLQLLTAAVAPTPSAIREANGSIRHALIARVHHHIDTHLLQADLTPDRICRDVGLSRSKLYQLFEGKEGVVRQIQKKRLFHAYRKLADPNRVRARISEIAYSHGFSNEKHFYRLFKAEFGHTPNETRERMVDFIMLPKRGGPIAQREGAGSPSGWTLPFGIRR